MIRAVKSGFAKAAGDPRDASGYFKTGTSMFVAGLWIPRTAMSIRVLIQQVPTGVICSLGQTNSRSEPEPRCRAVTRLPY